ncbi:PREDICTED: uncharacterized protein LOC109356214 [Lupinus angustifolius]|uniref:uncharacterized protein LOC109356214 n=1 Tax=Lupinus angustifolius TaxID=3871 RepID=UPI00092E6E53|nr:PREDICTED: uncharacterized protein LOC109356214 [Lupinus angustifolius]
MNGAVEAANKNIKKIVAKMVENYKDWHEKLPYALHAYRTNIRSSTGATPFSLVYGMEAVSPIEVEIPSLRVLMEAELEESEWVKARYEQLNMIEEKRLAAICHDQLYQGRVARAFDKKVYPREFEAGDLVLKKILPNQEDARGKWAPNYEGPYIVKNAFSGGALVLQDMDGNVLARPVNIDADKETHRNLTPMGMSLEKWVLLLENNGSPNVDPLIYEKEERKCSSRERGVGRYRLRLKPPSQPHRSNRGTGQQPWRAACLSRTHRGLDRAVQRRSMRLAASAPP